MQIKAANLPSLYRTDGLSQHFFWSQGILSDWCLMHKKSALVVWRMDIITGHHLYVNYFG